MQIFKNEIIRESLPTFGPARGRLVKQEKQGGLLYWSRLKSASEIDLVIADIAVLGLIACWFRHHGVGTGYIPCVDIRVSAMDVGITVSGLDTSRVSASRCRDWTTSRESTSWCP
jgi:hypothetical protein